MRASRDRGFTLLELLVVMGVIAVLVALLLPAILAVRRSYLRHACQNNLRQIGLALLQYQSAYGVFPFGVGADEDWREGQSLYSSPLNRRYSLHSQILPFLEQSDLYDQINFDDTPFFFANISQYSEFLTGLGSNETAAQAQLSVFLCPADKDRMAIYPWGKTNYRSCNGGTWSGRRGDGLFSQVSSTTPQSAIKGLSKTAAFSERIRGDAKADAIDENADLLTFLGQLTEEELQQRCISMPVEEVATIPHDSDGGKTWMEGNMNWTRYNHVLPPQHRSCKNEITWNGVAMTATSKHPGGVNILFGDGRVDFAASDIDASLWRATGSMLADVGGF